ncbi:hypothetical protein H1R20_g6114, partial [Candolleomyces eurysporus]
MKAQNWGAQKVVGVDLDESLIEGAWRRRRALWSTQGPSSPSTSISTPQELKAPSSELGVRRKRSRSKVDSDDDSPSPAPRRSHNSNSNYFPASCEHEFGSLPIPPANPSNPSRGKNVFPHNVTFVKADWVDEDIVEDKIEGGWDVVVAFSISKWIHLNKGDAGLLTFFHKVFRVLHAGGTFVLEPQPWDSYAKAKRMDGRLKENARHLSLRPNLQREGEEKDEDEDEGEGKLKSFEEVLVDEVGFKKLKRIEVQGEGVQYNSESMDYTYERKERETQGNSKAGMDVESNEARNRRERMEPTSTKSKHTKKQGEKIMKYVYEFPDKVNGSRFFSTTVSSISDYRTVAVTGRNSRVFKVIELEKRGTSWREKGGTEPIVLQVVWLDANARTERQIQDQLFANIQSFCGKPDRKSEDRLDFFADPEAAGIIQAFKAVLQNNEHTPVDHLPSVGDAFSVLSQSITALRLMFCAGWIHRDITAGNVMAVQDANGGGKIRLADLEHAKAFKDGSPPTTDPKMGTPYFMAHELLSRDYVCDGMQNVDEGTLKETVEMFKEPIVPSSEEHPLRHNFQHDLESVFWIALWIITARIDHTPSIQYAKLIFTGTGSFSSSHSEDRKRAFTRDINSGAPSPAFESAAEAVSVLVASRGSMGSPTRRGAKPPERGTSDKRSWPGKDQGQPEGSRSQKRAADIYKLKPTKKKGAKIAMKYIYEFSDKVNGSRFVSTTVSSISDYRTVAVTSRKARVFKFIEVEKRGTSWRKKGGTKPIAPKVVWLDANGRTERQIHDQLLIDIQSFCGRPGRKSDDRLHFFADPEAAGIIQTFKAELQDSKPYKNLFLSIKARPTDHPSKEVLGSAHPADPPVFLNKSMTATGDGIQIPSRQTFQVTNPSQDKTQKPEYRRFAPKKRCFHLFAEECTPVDHLPTVGDAFSVLSQCVIALRLMFCVGWIHRDISAGNVLALQDANGGWKLKLADLEHAKMFKDGSPPTTDPITGTPYFMAYEILSHNYIRVGTQSLISNTVKEMFQSMRQPVVSPDSQEYPMRHNFQHDLESLFWIALWILTARINHTPSIRHSKRIFTKTANLYPSGPRQSALFLDISETLSKCLAEPLRPLARILERVRNVLYIQAYRRGEELSWEDEKSYSLIHADSEVPAPAPECAAEAPSVLVASRGMFTIILNRDGLDTHVQIRLPQEPTSTRSKPTKKRGVKIAMKYVYEFPDKVNGPRFFSTTDSSIRHCRTVAVTGRNTHVFKVIEVEKRGTSWREKGGTESIVLKVVWLNANGCTERQIHDQLFADIQSFCGNPDWKSDDRLYLFADPEAAGVIQAFKAELQNKVLSNARLADPLPAFLKKLMTTTGDGIRIPSRQTFQVTNPSQEKTQRPEYRRFAPKKRCFHLFAEECTPVDYLPTVGDAFSVLSQCVIALRLMFCAGWIHRDVGAGNVMAVQAGNGGWKLKLADLEHAKAFKDGSPPTTDPKTGMPYFMANELLSRDYVRDGTQSVEEGTLKETRKQKGRQRLVRPPSKEYPLRSNFQHDLESVFWIALWILTARINHIPSVKYANLIFTSTTYLSMPIDRRRAFDRHIDINGALSECLLEPLLPLVEFLEDVRDDLYAAAFYRGEKVAWHDEKSYSLIHAKMAIHFAWTLEDTRGWGDVPLALPDSKMALPAPESAADVAGMLSALYGSMGPPKLPVDRVESGWHGAKSLAHWTSKKHSRPGEDQDQPEKSLNYGRKRARSVDREGVSGSVASTSAPA